jgi:hypothetical protein
MPPEEKNFKILSGKSSLQVMIAPNPEAKLSFPETSTGLEGVGFPEYSTFCAKIVKIYIFVYLG